MHIRCTLVIYLYLLDADGVNTIVLATYTFSTGIELWKVLKVLRLRSVSYTHLTLPTILLV